MTIFYNALGLVLRALVDQGQLLSKLLGHCDSHNGSTRMSKGDDLRFFVLTGAVVTRFSMSTLWCTRSMHAHAVTQGAGKILQTAQKGTSLQTYSKELYKPCLTVFTTRRIHIQCQLVLLISNAPLLPLTWTFTGQSAQEFRLQFLGASKVRKFGVISFCISTGRFCRHAIVPDHII